VNLASASDAVVIGFNTRLDPGAQRSVETTGVDVRIYDVIYKLTDDIGLALSGLLEPKLVEQVEGHAEVRMVIKAGRAGNVAGSYVTDGRIVRGGQARVVRGGEVIADTRITSLKRFKDDVREVATGFECGIGLDFDDIAEGDAIECYQMVAERA
jgi:translation initiation factor IF-2